MRTRQSSKPPTAKSKKVPKKKKIAKSNKVAGPKEFTHFIDLTRPINGLTEGDPGTSAYTIQDIQRIANAHAKSNPVNFGNGYQDSLNEEDLYDLLGRMNAGGRRCAYYATDGNLPEPELMGLVGDIVGVTNKKKLVALFTKALNDHFGPSISWKGKPGWRHLCMLLSGKTFGPGYWFRDYHFAKQVGNEWWHFFRGPIGSQQVFKEMTDELPVIHMDGTVYRPVLEFWLAGQGRDCSAWYERENLRYLQPRWLRTSCGS